MLVFLLDCLRFSKLLKLYQTEGRISSNLLKRKQSSRKTSIVWRWLNTRSYESSYPIENYYCISRSSIQNTKTISLLFLPYFLTSNILIMLPNCDFVSGLTLSGKCSFSHFFLFLLRTLFWWSQNGELNRHHFHENGSFGHGVIIHSHSQRSVLRVFSLDQSIRYFYLKLIN